MKMKNWALTLALMARSDTTSRGRPDHVYRGGNGWNLTHSCGGGAQVCIGKSINREDKDELGQANDRLFS